MARRLPSSDTKIPNGGPPGTVGDTQIVLARASSCLAALLKQWALLTMPSLPRQLLAGDAAEAHVFAAVAKHQLHVLGAAVVAAGISHRELMADPGCSTANGGS
jgi:hypothetical protein